MKQRSSKTENRLDAALTVFWLVFLLWALAPQLFALMFR